MKKVKKEDKEKFMERIRKAGSEKYETSWNKAGVFSTSKKKSEIKKGKNSRARGARFELKVRRDLEEKGRIVDKWNNNVDLGGSSKDTQGYPKGHKGHKNNTRLREYPKGTRPFQGLQAGDSGEPSSKDDSGEPSSKDDSCEPKLIIAKKKFNPWSKVMTIGTGFPDFISIKQIHEGVYSVIGVEVKMNGVLSKIEKQKCAWYLKNGIFSNIWIAKKGETPKGVPRDISKEMSTRGKRGQIEYVDFAERYGKKFN